MKLNKVLRKVILVAVVTCSTFCMAQKHDLSRLITAIATVESKQNEKAVSKDCAGYLQIMPSMVKECNRILKQQGQKKRYTLKDRFSKQKSIEMFYIIQNTYNPSHNIEKALCLWNAGSTKKRPIRYIRRVMKVYKTLR